MNQVNLINENMNEMIQNLYYFTSLFIDTIRENLDQQPAAAWGKQEDFGLIIFEQKNSSDWETMFKSYGEPDEQITKWISIMKESAELMQEKINQFIENSIESQTCIKCKLDSQESEEEVLEDIKKYTTEKMTQFLKLSTIEADLYDMVNDLKPVINFYDNAQYYLKTYQEGCPYVVENTYRVSRLKEGIGEINETILKINKQFHENVTFDFAHKRINEYWEELIVDSVKNALAREQKKSEKDLTKIRKICSKVLWKASSNWCLKKEVMNEVSFCTFSYGIEVREATKLLKKYEKEWKNERDHDRTPIAQKLRYKETTESNKRKCNGYMHGRCPEEFWVEELDQCDRFQYYSKNVIEHGSDNPNSYLYCPFFSFDRFYQCIDLENAVQNCLLPFIMASYIINENQTQDKLRKDDIIMLSEGLIEADNRHRSAAVLSRAECLCFKKKIKIAVDDILSANSIFADESQSKLLNKAKWRRKIFFSCAYFCCRYFENFNEPDKIDYGLNLFLFQVSTNAFLMCGSQNISIIDDELYFDSQKAKNKIIEWYSADPVEEETWD